MSCSTCRTQANKRSAGSVTAIVTPSARLASRQLDRTIIEIEDVRTSPRRRRWLQFRKALTERAFVPKVEVAR